MLYQCYDHYSLGFLVVVSSRCLVASSFTVYQLYWPLFCTCISLNSSFWPLRQICYDIRAKFHLCCRYLRAYSYYQLLQLLYNSQFKYPKVGISSTQLIFWYKTTPKLTVQFMNWLPSDEVCKYLKLQDMVI